MKNILVLQLFLLLGVSKLWCQKLEVKDFKAELNDPAATQFAVKDFNGQNCALIIVGLAVDGVQFEGNIIKQERKENGEYWVYITDGSMDFQINSKEYLPEPVEFNTFGVTSVESGRTYRMFVEHPNLEKSFDEILAIAKDYYKEYPSHTESSYYDAARIAYDNAIKHNDCPQNIRESIREERDTMASIRRNTYLIEAAEAKAKQFEKEKGFACDEVYRYLSGEVRFADRILRYHPEISGIQSLKDRVIARLHGHPKGQNIVEKTVVKERETISGIISFKNEFMAIPFENMQVFATSSAKIKGGESRKIGNINADGSYKVVKPVGISPLYIYVTGEKDKAHYVPEGTTIMNIEVK